MFRLLLYFILFITLHLLIWSCNTTPKNNEEGYALAERYCQGCHQLPQPGHLSKAMWEQHVMPKMGHFLGIYKSEEERLSLFENNEGDSFLIQKNIYPSKPVISSEDWQKIKQYFIENAPEELKTTPLALEKNNPFFNAIIPPNVFSPPSTTLLKFKKNGGIYFGDANKQQFIELNPDFSIKRAIEVEEGAVCVNETETEQYVTFMGQFAPTDNPKGMIMSLPKNGIEGATILIDQLRRPVHTSVSDIDGDGLPDLVVCEFGKFTGCLSWFKNLGNGKYKKQVLWDKPGATKAYIEDMNNDGKQDIVALFAQADEGIDIYYNQGNGQFKRERVLQFPPSYGSSSLQIQDLNNDGKKDLIYTAGDNADFLPILKPYHGIYLYENEGNNVFKNRLFLPLNGAYSAFVHDFDNDGHKDIAAISFFPDWQHQLEQGFVFYKNLGGNFYDAKNFKAYSINKVNKGRWILMDCGDYDNDGDMDICLGSLIMEVVPKIGIEEQWIKEGIPFLILENKLK